MPLIDLKTDLKSLKYGQDKPGGNSSGQPFITTNVDGLHGTQFTFPGTSLLNLIGLNNLTLPTLPNIGADLGRSKIGRIVNEFVSGDDLIRGGALGAAQASVNDAFRIGSFFLSLPKGPIFIAKQVGLQLSNPKLENDKSFSNGFTGLAKLTTKLTGGIFQPTRLYNLGVNTLAQVPANAFGIHFNRHGLSPIQDDSTKYETVVRSNNRDDSSNNRLVGLREKFSLGSIKNFGFEATDDYSAAKERIDNQNQAIRKIYRNQKKTYRQSVRAAKDINKANANMAANGIGLFGIEGAAAAATPIASPLSKPTKPKYVKFNPAALAIDTYLGGPGSTYGVGLTILKRYSFTEDLEKNDDARLNSETYAGKSRETSESIKYSEKVGTESPLSEYPGVPNDANTINNVIGQTSITGMTSATATYKKISDKIVGQNVLSQTIPYSEVSGSAIGSYALSPYAKAITTVDTKVNRGTSDTKYYGEGKLVDKFLGTKKKYSNTDTFARQDAAIMSIIFRAVDPFGDDTETWIFPAYMKGFKDNFTGTWNETNYVGRSESFYVYNKFKRDVSFNLSIPCFNKVELFEKHRALGQLASTTAGSYSNNFLGGVLLKLNVGNYLNGEYAVLNSLTYDIPDDASWDISNDAFLAMYLNASFNFTIIHKNRPGYVHSPAQGTNKNGFFGYLTDPQTPNSSDRYSGFITSQQVVDKFRKG